MPDYQQTPFSTRDDPAQLLIARALDHLKDIPKPDVLDLGCGTGTVAIGLAVRRPDLSAVALDMSRPNVEAARRGAAAAGVAARVAAVDADFTTWSHTPFDAIVSDGVLHLISEPDAALATRLARQLKPGGLLLATMPVESFGNRLRIASRHLWQFLPRAADRLAMLVARRLHPDLAAEMLEERLVYLRVIPARLFNSRLRALFESIGLGLVAEERWPSPSIMKLDHHLLVWRRSPGAEQAPHAVHQ